jgi:hypothetical protein
MAGTRMGEAVLRRKQIVRRLDQVVARSQLRNKRVTHPQPHPAICDDDCVRE